MPLTAAQKDLLIRFDTSYSNGLSNESASTRRRASGMTNGARLTPPVDCPAWACVLLPCINHLPSMKMFRLVRPDDAEVLREGHWICYDAASLVPGDIIRLNACDTVPADCTVLSLGMNLTDETMEEAYPIGEELAVDHKLIFGEKKPRTTTMSKELTCEPVQFFCGGTVLEGSGIAIVTAVGNHTLLASLMCDGKWPVQGDISKELKTENPTDAQFINEDFEIKKKLLRNEELV
mmetsp:Transcript_22411/g.21545  ORF Transcript_22411/g.21545 Transcript_22411/m.21545 type:complete len:235 (-) Transcript_22411:198-902(-)|eukprot:CAMPEP_0197835008 /NCGR_PEP_ID=MMETSP1437-20131217/24450_1 /TAXON_ID=49252 ORGANISM="Eucampia antarctica, Strain CCMP1452" /NCGR_SAMPLE_ID=MMETSP1437 /ASSEMBLY_ACC=CAM_ASM_001096 /LENGTH=234 /DNA_ID=CAMNT_0043440131 /DNA_START=50 /DNA_END=754 /DNA_ORIENTATION=+